MASLALLTDASSRWRPCAFSYKLLGCEMRIDFPIAKLQDYADRVDELLILDNPFALVTVAHLLTQKTKDNAHRRRIAKWRLTKQLYQRKWDRQRIINLYRVIDWIMSLPKELDARLHEGIVQWERRNAMTYLSSIERIGMEIGMKKGEELGWQKGLEEGRQEGRREALLEMLTILLTERFGKLDAMSSAILTVAGVDELTAWSKNVLAARSLSEVFADK